MLYTLHTYLTYRNTYRGYIQQNLIIQDVKSITYVNDREKSEIKLSSHALLDMAQQYLVTSMTLRIRSAHFKVIVLINLLPLTVEQLPFMKVFWDKKFFLQRQVI